MTDIKIAQQAQQVKACYRVFKQLRPHLDEQAFIEQALRQMDRYDYQMAYIEVGPQVVCACGYRVTEHLAWGRTFYIDDLITDEQARGQGYASRLLEWMIEQAGQLKCNQLHLDSGTQRHAAHRLYLQKGFAIKSLHFSQNL